jgi:hypothetical protein
VDPHPIEHASHATESQQPAPADLDRLARQATTHCLTGCAIGEVLGMVIAGIAGLAAGPAVVLSIALAFVFGYGLTMRPLLSSGSSLSGALGLAFAADTVSITVMEAIDNATVLLVPGAMAAGLGDPLFWAALAGGFVIAWLVTYPVNRWLIARGRGHAVVHGAHLNVDEEGSDQ